MPEPECFDVRVLVAGPAQGIVAEGTVAVGTVQAQGTVLRLDEPLSLWGGLDPKTGEIIDRRHPQSGAIVTGRMLVLPSGRGSSSASSILLETVRRGTMPAAIILAEVDGILALGATVAREIYDRTLPMVVAPPDVYELLTDGRSIHLVDEGRRLLCGETAAGPMESV